MTHPFITHNGGPCPVSAETKGVPPMIWSMSNRADPFAAAIADRHYSRQKVGAKQFVPPGRCLVLKAGSPDRGAYWVTSWPFAEFVKHEWAGAWMCSAFRNEGAGVASEMIIEAVAATRYFFGPPPSLGMVTFIDRTKVRPTMVRKKPVWGWTFMKAGFAICGETKGGLLALALAPDRMPQAAPAEPAEPDLFPRYRLHQPDKGETS